jgi:hypothetical protein
VLAQAVVPSTSAYTWDAVRNGALNAQVSTRINGVDYADKGHSLLGMHANSGVTFDLAKIRAANGFAHIRLRAMIGFGAAESAAKSLADLTVLLDGQVVFQKLGMRKSDSATIDVPIPVEIHTLSLIATDGGDGIGSDLLFLGDPRLSSEEDSSSSTKTDEAKQQQLRATIARFEKALRALGDSSKVYAVINTEAPQPMRVQRRGNPEEETTEVWPGTFAWARHAPAVFGDNSMGEGERRHAMAEWIVHPDNPLTARVVVNRVWHHLFGQGIVNTPSDFGTGGGRPSHPELLDWLANELIRNGWSLKHIQRLILNSATYRQSSRASNPLAARVDTQNRLLWRQSSRRLDAESLHDAVLFVSGKLNLEMGGPGFKDFKYTEAYAPIYEYITPDEPALWRRSIYRFIVRTTPHRFLTTLDCPDPANFTPVRNRTTTALQALTLSNNDFMLRQAGYLSQRVVADSSGHGGYVESKDGRGDMVQVEAWVKRAFQLCFQREPDAAELLGATDVCKEHGLFALCRILLNANEFVYID